MRDCHKIPPHQGSGAGIAINVGEWVSGWVDGTPLLRNWQSEKGLLITKKSRKMLGVFEVFEKTRSFSKQAHSYFLYVGVPRWVTKLFRIEGENMRCSEIQIGGNSFREIRYFSVKSCFFTKIIQFRRKNVHFQKKGVIFANSAKMTHVSHG